MSLLLDARKKSQQARSAPGEVGGHSGLASGSGTYPDSQPFESPRNAGKNLFSAKHPASPARAGINRNLLIALGGTVVLLALGAGYVWYVTSGDNVQPLRPIKAPAVASPSRPAPPAVVAQNNPVPQMVIPRDVLPSSSATPQPADTSRPAVKKSLPKARRNNAVHIERQVEPIDPLLNDAYLAYVNGKHEQAQQLYLKVLGLDARNIDALLGMAAIAQLHGSDNEAAHYYSQALVLDPRNAVANAGMSALTNNANRESRLKDLLNEQPDSSSLHFALGNYYAGQSRWGEAQQSYANAYRLEPGNAALALNLAVSLDRLGQKKSAAQYYQRALQLDQSHSAGFDHAQIEQRVQELTR